MFKCSEINTYTSENADDVRRSDLLKHILGCRECLKDISSEGYSVDDAVLVILNDMDQNDNNILSANRYKSFKEENLKMIRNIALSKSNKLNKNEGKNSFFSSFLKFLTPNNFLSPSFAALLLVFVLGVFFIKSSSTISNKNNLNYIGFKGEGNTGNLISMKFSVVDNKKGEVSSGKKDGTYSKNHLFAFQYIIKESGNVSIFHISKGGSLNLVMSDNKPAGTHLWQVDGDAKGYELKGFTGEQVFVSVFSKDDIDPFNLKSKNVLNELLAKEGVSYDIFKVYIH